MPFRSHHPRAPLTPIFRLAGRALSLHESYKNTVLNVQPANLVAFWPMDETSGTTADNAEGTAARDGAYTGVTLNSTTGPFGGSAAGLWDGSSDYNNIYTTDGSTGLVETFNGAEGTATVWGKVSAAGVWSDGTSRFGLRLAVDSNNLVALLKTTTTNEVRVQYIAGSTNKLVASTSLGGSTGWFQLSITWSAAGDAVKAYINGAQVGTTQTGLGTFAGSLASTTTLVGAGTTGPVSPWDGYLSYAAVWDTPLTPAQILTLYNGGPI